MDYGHTYNNIQSRVYKIVEYKFLIELIEGRKTGRQYKSVINNFGARLYDFREKFTFEAFSNSRNFSQFYNTFESRKFHYKTNCENSIFKNEVKALYEKDSIRNEIAYDSIVYTLSVYENCIKIFKYINDYSEFYEIIFDHGNFDDYLFSENKISMNNHFEKLKEKYNISNIQKIIKVSTQNTIKKYDKQNNAITLRGIEFTLLEFALYNRLWSDFTSDGKMVLRELYDKIMIDFNDPFNDIRENKRYDSTPFYTALKANNPYDNDAFNQCITLDKILELLASTKNIKFVKYIKQRKRVLKDKRRCN